MPQEKINLTVLGVPIAVRPGADASRVREAIGIVEKRFENQLQRSRGGQAKDVLLTFMALGLADELLQLQKQQEEEHGRVRALLSKIEEAK